MDEQTVTLLPVGWSDVLYGLDEMARTATRLSPAGDAFAALMTGLADEIRRQLGRTAAASSVGQEDTQ